VSFTSSRWLAPAALFLSVALAACGGSSSAPPAPSTAATPVATTAAPSAASVTTAPAASAAPISTPTTTTAAATCPTAATVDAALGTSLPAPVGIATGSTGLPAGATGVACEYHASAYNVIIELISNIAPSSITNFTKNFPVPPVAVSGVGDQAQSFSQSLGPGKVNEGVVATKGSTLVSIGATYTPATLAQVEALVNSLL
jgi:hypothetical protein